MRDSARGLEDRASAGERDSPLDGLGAHVVEQHDVGAGIKGDWLTTGLAWLRRYRVAAALVGGVTPLLRGGGRWRRLLRVAVIGGAGWLGWRFVRDRGR